jgi:hypothetical protein
MERGTHGASRAKKRPFFCTEGLACLTKLVKSQADSRANEAQTTRSAHAVPFEEEVAVPSEAMEDRWEPLPSEAVPREEKVAVPSGAMAVPSGAMEVPLEAVPLEEEVAVPSGAMEVSLEAVPLEEEVAVPSGAMEVPSEAVPLEEEVAVPSGAMEVPSEAVPLEEEVERPALLSEPGTVGLTLLSDSVVAAQNDREAVDEQPESTRQKFCEKYNTIVSNFDQSLAKLDVDLAAELANIVGKVESVREKRDVAKGTKDRTEKYAASWVGCNDNFTKAMGKLDSDNELNSRIQEQVCDVAEYERGGGAAIDAFERSWDKADEQNKVDLDAMYDTNGIDKGVIYEEIVATYNAYIKNWKRSLQTLREDWHVINNRAENASAELLVVQEQEIVGENDAEPATQEDARQRLHVIVTATHNRLVEGVIARAKATKFGLFDLADGHNPKQRYRGLNDISL